MKSKLFLVLTFMVVWLTACSTATPTTPDTPTDSATPVTSDTDKITLRVWAHQSSSFNQSTQATIDQFMQEHPTIDVKYETFPFDVFVQTLQTSLPAGTTADVVEIQGLQVCPYARGGQLLPVPTAMLTYEQAQELYFQAPLDAYYCDGQLYGFPSEYNIEYGGAYVNKALFEAKGLPYPPQWASWNDVITDAQQVAEVQDGAMTKAGLHYTNNDQIFTNFLSGILQLGGTYFAEDGRHFNFDTPEARQVIQLMVDNAQKDQVVDPVLFNGESNWVGEAFAQGNVGIAILGSWYAGEAAITHPELTFDYVALPPLFGSEHKFTSVGGWGKVVSASTEHPTEAWMLAEYLAANQANAFTFNSTTGTIPALKSVAADPALGESAPYLVATLGLLDGGQFQGNLTDGTQLEFEIIYPAILDAMQGLSTVDEAALRIHEEANAMVDANTP